MADETVIRHPAELEFLFRRISDAQAKAVRDVPLPSQQSPTAGCSAGLYLG
jgi:hypothetical protein